MLKLQDFQARVGAVEVKGKVTKVTLGTSRNANAGKKNSDGGWVEPDWVYSNWFCTFFGEDAKKLEVGDIVSVQDAQLKNEKFVKENGDAVYSTQMTVFEGKWSWKDKKPAKSSPKTTKAKKAEETNEFE